MRRRWPATRQLPAAFALALVLVGCGGGSADQIKGTFAAFENALRQHDAAGACRRITPAFYKALAENINAELSADSATQLSTSDCQAGLQRLFKLIGNRQLVRSGVVLTAIAVNGSAATARQQTKGLPGAPMRFVRTGRQWRIECCTGRQLEEQPKIPYRVPSGSMLPTLQIGQEVIADHAALRDHPPPLGAIVVFHPPAGADPATPMCGAPHEGAGTPRVCGKPTAGESAQRFIKRIVGLPGDTIAIRGGEVIRNGKPEQRTWKVRPCEDALLQGCTFPKPVTIPPDEYFVLGDNIGESDDSRFWGPVKRAWLIGIVKTG
jgi:signal peptidase I